MTDYFAMEFDIDADRAAFPDDVIAGPEPASPEPERHSLDEWRELRIAARECPMPGCAGRLDDDFNCAACGCTSLPAVLNREVGRVTIPLPPHELPFDEYSPAAVDDEAA